MCINAQLQHEQTVRTFHTPLPIIQSKFVRQANSEALAFSPQLCQSKFVRQANSEALAFSPQLCRYQCVNFRQTTSGTALQGCSESPGCRHPQNLLRLSVKSWHCIAMWRDCHVMCHVNASMPCA